MNYSSSRNYNARNYVVYDYNSQEILEGKDYYSQYSVASISKIMTAIIALESNRLFEVVVVDEIINTIEGSSLYLEVGSQITLIDLVYGLLLRSGNDAAVLIAKFISNDIESFVNVMNEKALSIGMKNTYFSNPSGLDIFDEGNLSSCFDMALLMSYCMDNPLFLEINSCKYYKSSLKGVWINKNKLLHSYKYCIGGKTGYTRKARRTLITSSRKDEDTLIIVSFDCSTDFDFHKSIYEKYYSNFRYVLFLVKGVNYIDSYYLYSDKVIGIRIDKNIKNGVKLYYINPITNIVTIKFISGNYEYVYDQGIEVHYHQ
jgi:D-alanyl-D-alanine carboxypeptidase